MPRQLGDHEEGSALRNFRESELLFEHGASQLLRFSFPPNLALTAIPNILNSTGGSVERNSTSTNTIRNIVIRKHVEDLQLGVKSYQTKLNLEQPNWDASDFLFKEDYTIVNKPRAVIYRDKDDNKKMMRIDEVHKFSDGTLMRIRDKLDFMVKDFRLFKFNKGMETRKWTEDDKRRSEDFIEDNLKMEMEMEIPKQRWPDPLQDDVRLCLGDDLKKAQDHNQRQVKDESKDHYPKLSELVGCNKDDDGIRIEWIKLVGLVVNGIRLVLVASEVGAAVVASPAGVLELDTHSSSKADPSESSLPLVSIAPMVSPFLCSDDSESDTEMPERHVSSTRHDAMLAR
ncbi:hypothetical protein Tco_1031107 [Tanacetum coccineum]|uniref:Uncharacterized protein n=1 Tax=Tanacetum coccineum TaxID=301880 RepID=A0ABQ5G825_9ASTR